MLDHSFVDGKPHTGLSYYSLKQVDFDGRAGYSETRTSMIGIRGLTYFAYPNPATTTLNLSFSGEAAFEGTFRMIDSYGNIVLEKNVIIGDQRQHAKLDLESLAVGNYIMQVISDEQKRVAVVK